MFNKTILNQSVINEHYDVLSLTNCTFIDCYFYVEIEELTITNCLFIDCHLVADIDQCTITRSYFHGCDIDIIDKPYITNGYIDKNTLTDLTEPTVIIGAHFFPILGSLEYIDKITHNQMFHILPKTTQTFLEVSQ